ncbi:GATA transcription factor 5-like [Prosopis cineraria]|uniref:GATA transcription factor 5-like n=1 Tax=Prosopis cineraria TaxID=364024 RepID=UPI00240F2F60|nr:GATA transcription factor 5-like [Prosopis cineraria]
MEVVVANALKSSLHRELTCLKSTQQAFGEEIWCFNSNNGVAGEDFSVDDLFDFSQNEFQPEYEEDDEEKDSLSCSSSHDRSEEDTNSNSSSLAGDSDFIFSNELAVPDDDLADLEWVSHFVDDSVPELSLLYPVRSGEAKTRSEPEPSRGFAKTPCLPFEFPVKARSTKRRRARMFIPLLSRPSSPPSSCSSVFSSTLTLIAVGTAPSTGFVQSVTETPVKKQKKRAEAQAGSGSGSQIQRRCTHCLVQKTPQWRTGPLGPKTLCNACGVRYKSGRLFPEYRPACSPTFSSNIHSNSHRKVLEMRKRKEMSEPECGLTRTQTVPSC